METMNRKKCFEIASRTLWCDFTNAMKSIYLLVFICVIAMINLSSISILCYTYLVFLFMESINPGMKRIYFVSPFTARERKMIMAYKEIIIELGCLMILVFTFMIYKYICHSVIWYAYTSQGMTLMWLAELFSLIQGRKYRKEKNPKSASERTPKIFNTILLVAFSAIFAFGSMYAMGADDEQRGIISILCMLTVLLMFVVEKWYEFSKSSFEKYVIVKSVMFSGKNKDVT